MRWGYFFAIVGKGLYSGKGWSWKSAVIAQGVSIPLNVLTSLFLALQPGAEVASLLSRWLIPTIILNIVSLYYMLKPRTRAYFGKIQLDENRSTDTGISNRPY